MREYNNHKSNISPQPLSIAGLVMIYPSSEECFLMQKEKKKKRIDFCPFLKALNSRYQQRQEAMNRTTSLHIGVD